MIEIHGVHKRFGPLEVLKGVDLVIRPGVVTAIVGPNAAGKTTLMKCVLGLTMIDSGRIKVLDTVLNGDWAYRRHIGYMAQIARFPDNLSTAELLRLLRNLRDGGAPDNSDELVEAFGLGSELSKPLKTLSGGTRQKVSATIALMFDPAILVLDEPTAGLDPQASSYLKDVISDHRTRGKTIVMTSHIMSEIDELADRIVYLLDGKVIFDDEKAALKQRSGDVRLDRALVNALAEAQT